MVEKLKKYSSDKKGDDVMNIFDSIMTDSGNLGGRNKQTDRSCTPYDLDNSNRPRLPYKV